MIHHADVRDGKVILWNREAFYKQVRALEGKRIEVDLDVHRDRRSDGQNRYFHGVVVPMISEHLGWEKEEIKEYLKQKFLLVERDGRQFCRPTSTLDTKDMAEFCDRCIRWAAIELELYIPDPGQ